MVKLVGTPIGNLEDITFRAKRELEEAEIVLAEDTRIARKLFQLLQIPTTGKKFISCHAHNIWSTLNKLGADLLKEKRVVFVSDAGMPGISDPGAEIVRFCRREGVLYEVVPGVSAVTTAFSASGFEGGFRFEGFLPPKGQKREERLKELLKEPVPVVLYEAPHRLNRLLEELGRLASGRPLFLAKELTKKFESYIFGRAGEIEIENPKGEWVVIIGPSSPNFPIGEFLKGRESIHSGNSGMDQADSNQIGRAPSTTNQSTVDQSEVEKISSTKTALPEKIELELEQFLALPIPPKQKAKLLSSLTGLPVKQVYKLISQYE